MTPHAAMIPLTPPTLAAVPAIAGVRRASDLDLTADLLPTGVAPLDAAVGGLALCRTHFLVGTRGHGATALLHRVLAAVTPTAPVLLLDPAHCFAPAAAATVGVHLPHLLLVHTDDPKRIGQTLAAALRADACPLIVWCTPSLPAPALLARLAPLVRGGRSALLLVATGAPFARSPANGLTLLVQGGRWVQGGAARPGVMGRHLLVTATDHRRARTLTVPLTFTFPQPLPPFLRPPGKGGEGDADTTRRGLVAARVSPASRRAG